MQTDAERLRDVLAEYRRHVDRGHDEAAQTAHVRHLAIVEDIQAVPDPVATGGAKGQLL